MYDGEPRYERYADFDQGNTCCTSNGEYQRNKQYEAYLKEYRNPYDETDNHHCPMDALLSEQGD
ncbi:hypothetical protein D3C73_1634320 [compost metagenome]